MHHSFSRIIAGKVNDMDNQKVGRFIAALRKKKEWTQNDLAQALGVTDKAVSKWERGAGYPDIGMLRPLSDALGTTVNALLEGGDSDEDVPDDQKDMVNALEYADKVITVKNRRAGKIIAAIIGITLLIGIFVSIIVNVAVSNNLTWAVMVIASCVFAGAIVIPPFIYKIRGLLCSFCLLTVLLIPFLMAIEYSAADFGAPSSWLWSMGAPISAIWIGLAWLMLLIRKIKKTNMFIYSAIGTFLCIPGVVLTNYIVDRCLLRDPNFYPSQISTVSSVIGLLCIAGVLLVIGLSKRKSGER